MHVFSCFSLRFLILILKFFDGFPRQPAALTGGADVLLLLGSSGVLLVLCYPEGPRRTQKDPAIAVRCGKYVCAVSRQVRGSCGVVS